MTDVLLKSHQEKNACKPNQVYTLKMTVRPSLRKRGVGRDACKACGGKGYCVMGKTKDSKGTICMPCPHHCVPDKDEYESFVRNAWAQVGMDVRVPSPTKDAHEENRNTGPPALHSG